jgi:uracil-DNA glycosylase
VIDKIPPSWQLAVGDETSQPYFKRLQAFLAKEREHFTVYPPEREVFTALELTMLEEVRVVLLGQDPYHGPGQAHGLAFSVRPGAAVPPSLLNIFKELKADAGVIAPNHGCLEHWARQGVLLLNAVLTVRARQPNSHKNKGWEIFTGRIIEAVNQQAEPAVFLLWGNDARQKRSLLDLKRHKVIESPHPSPLSASRGFFGSRPFSQANAFLETTGRGVIDWQIPDLPPEQLSE